MYASTEIQEVLALHNLYDSQKKQLTGQAWVEDSVKSEIELKLESEYAEVDVVVSQLLCDNHANSWKFVWLGSETTASWADRCNGKIIFQWNKEQSGKHKQTFPTAWFWSRYVYTCR